MVPCQRRVGAGRVRGGKHRGVGATAVGGAFNVVGHRPGSHRPGEDHVGGGNGGQACRRQRNGGYGRGDGHGIRDWPRRTVRGHIFYGARRPHGAGAAAIQVEGLMHPSVGIKVVAQLRQSHACRR